MAKLIMHGEYRMDKSSSSSQKFKIFAEMSLVFRFELLEAVELSEVDVSPLFARLAYWSLTC